jgi:hypothetical protein
VHLIAEAWIHYQVSPCEIYGGRSDGRIGFPPSTWIFPCHYHSTSAAYSIIYYRRSIILAKDSVIKQSASKQLKSQITEQHRVHKKLSVKFASILTFKS